MTGQPRPVQRMDANGTAWRMRSLVAMGHDATRIARALDITPDVVRRLIRGDSRTVAVGFHALACQLWNAWWDKRPPERTVTERRAAARACRQAMTCDWPAAAGLDEDRLDRPGCHYRPAAGTGVAADFDPYAIKQRQVREIA